MPPHTTSCAPAQVPDAARWALAVQVVSWYMQIHPGHAVFERRKPALLDSLFQVCRMGCMHVWWWREGALTNRLSAASPRCSTASSRCARWTGVVCFYGGAGCHLIPQLGPIPAAPLGALAAALLSSRELTVQPLLNTQAFALAPLFVWMELLFLLGYRPALRAKLGERVDTAIAAWRREQARAKAA